MHTAQFRAHPSLLIQLMQSSEVSSGERQFIKWIWKDVSTKWKKKTQFRNLPKKFLKQMNLFWKSFTNFTKNFSRKVLGNVQSLRIATVRTRAQISRLGCSFVLGTTQSKFQVFEQTSYRHYLPSGSSDVTVVPTKDNKLEKRFLRIASNGNFSQYYFSPLTPNKWS